MKQRKEEDGSNFRFIGNVCLITLNRYWEDNYRGLLAHVVGAKENQIQVPIFGEIAKYRHAILHSHGVATSDVEECALFTWYKKGDQILLDRGRFEEIIDAVFEFLDNVEKEPAQFIKRA